MQSRALGALRIVVAVGAGLWLLARPAVADDDSLRSQELADLARLDRDAPDAVELLRFGERAMAEEHYAAAAVRFAEARRFAPDVALPARRHCQALIALEQRHDALLACGAALDKGATEEDRSRLAAVLASGVSGTERHEIALLVPIALTLVAAGGIVVLWLRRIRRTSRLLSRIAV